MNYMNYVLGAILWVGIALSLFVSKVDDIVKVENDVLQSIMPPNGHVLNAFLIPRFPTSPTIELVRKHILDYFSNYLPSWHAEIDEFFDDTPLGKVTFQNLIFTKNVYARKKIVLAAHYDSKYSLNEREGALPDGFIGAIDSAWPCSLLIYLARIVDLYEKKVKHSPDSTIQIIFFDGEESIR